MQFIPHFLNIPSSLPQFDTSFQCRLRLSFAQKQRFAILRHPQKTAPQSLVRPFRQTFTGRFASILGPWQVDQLQ